jgi:hypothetical protein
MSPSQIEVNLLEPGVRCVELRGLTPGAKYFRLHEAGYWRTMMNDNLYDSNLRVQHVTKGT